MTLDREIAGRTCHQVLAALGDYVDGELPDDERAAVDGHLRACVECERFGGAIGALVGTVRRTLRDDAPPDVIDRLQARLAR
jgi:anti-sigma factor RsiW